MKRIFLLLLLGGTVLLAQEQTGDPPEGGTPIDETTLPLNFAQADQGDGDQNVSVPSVGFGDFLRIFLFLGLVILLIYLFFFFLKKLSGRETNPQDLVTVLASQNLRNDQVLYLVEVGQQVLLLGGGSGHLSLISEITDKETLDDLKLRASRDQTGKGGTFLSFLQGRSRKSDAGGVSLNLPFLQKQKDRLKKL